MREGCQVRSLRASVAAALGIALALLSAWPTAPPAAAEEPAAYVQVTFDSISPALPRRDGTVTLTGRVTNTAAVDLSDLQVLFWRSLDPIADPEARDAAVQSFANQPLGLRKNDVFQPIPSETDQVLAPGETARFSLTAPIEQLELPAADGVFLVGVHVRGINPELGVRSTIGRGRVFMPLVEEAPVNALRMTSIVTMTSQPALLRDALFRDDHLAAELGPNGRLSALARAADQPGMSFAVDPALVEEIQIMAGGYRVGSVDQSTAGTGQAAAVRWLTTFRGLLRNGDGFRLPYGFPDVAALAHAGRTDLLQRGEVAARSVGLTARLPLVVLPGDGLADAATVAAATALRPRAIVLSDASASGPSPLLAGENGVPLVSYTAAAFGGGPGPDPRNTPTQLGQRMLADTWIEASNASADATLGRVRLITSAAEATSDDGDVAAPWTRRTPLSELLRGKPATWSGELRYGPEQQARELTGDQVTGITRLSRDFDTLQELLVEPATVTATANRTVYRTTCSCWRGDPDRWRAYTGAQQRGLTTLLRDRITISATPLVVTSGRIGQFGITVRNGLDADPEDPELNAVTVLLVFDSANRQRLTIDPIELTGDNRILAGTSETLNAQVQAQVNGTVRVTALLTTESDTVIGRPFTIDVRVTQAGSIGWVIVVVAGVVLVGTTALRIRQVTRERAAHPTTDPLVVSRPPEDATDVDHRERLDV